MGRSMPGQRRPTSKPSLTTLVSTTEQTTIEVFKPEEIPDDWYQYLEQYLVPVAGTAVAIIAIRANAVSYTHLTLPTTPYV